MLLPGPLCPCTGLPSRSLLRTQPHSWNRSYQTQVSFTWGCEALWIWRKQRTIGYHDVLFDKQFRICNGAFIWEVPLFAGVSFQTPGMSIAIPKFSQSCHQIFKNTLTVKNIQCDCLHGSLEQQSLKPSISNGDIEVGSQVVWQKHHHTKMFLPSFELGTFRVWSERENHYTTETDMAQSTSAWPTNTCWVPFVFLIKGATSNC